MSVHSRRQGRGPADPSPEPLPRTPLRGRAHNGLRRVKRRWRRVFPRALPPWTDAVPAVARHDGDRLEIRGDTVGAVRARLDGLDLAVLGVHVVVDRWRPPWPGWSGRLGPVPGLLTYTVRLPAGAGATATVEILVSSPVAAAALVQAALTVLDPARPLPATLRTAASAPLVRSAPRIPRARGVEPWPAVPPTDGPPPDPDVVDLATANPVGRGPGGHDLAVGELSLTTGADGEVWWRVHSRGKRSRLVVAGRAGDPLDEPHRTALRRLGSLVHEDSAAGCAGRPHASVLAQLAATGVMLHAPDLRPATRALLGAELRDIVARPAAVRGADPLEWELRGVAQRRAAMRGHGGIPAGLPTVSAILVTRRPSYLARAVADLLAQSYPAVEIVIGLHGVELGPAERERLDRCPVPVEVVAVPAAVSLGEALAAATRAARGSLIAKVDDDDRYGPEHLWDLVLARAYSGAAVVGKPAEFVHLAAYDATVRRRMATEQYCDSVAGGTLLMSRGDLEDVGGWRPLPRAVDRALLDRVLHAGGLIYRTHGFGYVYSRHGDGHTWDPGPRYFLLNPARHWPGHPPYPEFGPGGRGP